MATEASTAQIEKQQSGSGPILPVRKWLLYVDKQLADNELHLLKLCLYPYFKSWRKADEAVYPSEIFHCLQSPAGSDDDTQQQILHAFICALKVIGGKRRGMLCITKLQEYGLNKPQGQEESTKFRFFQCYARVARDIEVEASAKKIIEEFYGRKLEENYRHFEHIADLFIAIHQKGLVGHDNYDEFYEVLQRCGKEYITVMEKHKSLGDIWPDTSTSPSSLNSASGKHKAAKDHPQSTPKTATNNLTGETQPLLNQPGRTDQTRVIVLVILSIIFLTAAWLGSSIYFIYECHSLSQDDVTVKVRENNTIIMSDVQPAIISKLAIRENVQYGDSPHEVDLFLAEYECNEVYSRVKDSEYHNSGQLRNFTPAIYLMPGSTISYTITPEDDQLQVHMFIVKGLKNIDNFDPSNDDDYPFSKKVPFGGPVSYDIHSPDFYAVFFLLPPTVPSNSNVSYNSTLQLKTIDISRLKIMKNSTLYNDNITEVWKPSLGWETCSHRKCLIAKILPQDSNFDKFIHLHAIFTSRSASGVYVAMSSLLTIISGLLFVVFIFILVWLFVGRKCSELYDHKVKPYLV